MSRTLKLKPRRTCFRGCDWCTSNRAPSRSADASTREALKNAHDADAIGACVVALSWDEETGACAWCGTHYECQDDLPGAAPDPVALGATLAEVWPLRDAES
jgi:hypothetical protein